MIRLNCFVEVSAENHPAALAAAKDLTAASLQQEGCVAYDTFESSTRPLIFMICETWKDEKALAAHAASAEFKKYVGEIQRLATMKIEQFTF